LERGAGFDACLALIEAFSQHPATYVFRREMLSAMRSALKIAMSSENADLAHAIWQVQNKVRHIGRHIAYRSVGSTLLVKGLRRRARCCRQDACLGWRPPPPKERRSRREPSFIRRAWHPWLPYGCPSARWQARLSFGRRKCGTELVDAFQTPSRCHHGQNLTTCSTRSARSESGATTILRGAAM